MYLLVAVLAMLMVYAYFFKSVTEKTEDLENNDIDESTSDNDDSSTSDNDESTSLLEEVAENNQSTNLEMHENPVLSG